LPIIRKDFSNLVVGLEAMYLNAVAMMLRSRRFWVWQLAGIAIYAMPAVVRFATGSVYLPVLGLFKIPWIGHFIPGNLVEKILVNAFFPGAAGAVAGELLYVNIHGLTFSRRQKYFARLGGALLWTAAWSLFQFWGNIQNLTGPWGGNIFEYPMIYPLNFLLASLSIFTPSIVVFAKTKIINVFSKPKPKKSEN
jgi:hypothetical protein